MDTPTPNKGKTEPQRNLVFIFYDYSKPMTSIGETAKYLGLAALIGTTAGIGTTPRGMETLSSTVKWVGAITDLRRRPPQPGDHWSGCRAARAAGTAPIYRGEPGYRETMDGDSDGIACEPYAGM